jgi:hypothetical protein
MSEALEAWDDYRESGSAFDPAQQYVTITAPDQLQKLRRWSKARLSLYALTDSNLVDDVLIVVAECGNNAVNYDRPSSFRRGTIALAISANAVQVVVSNPLPPASIESPIVRDALVEAVNTRLQPGLPLLLDTFGERGRGLGICGVLCADRGGNATAAIVMTSEDIQFQISATLPYDNTQ